MARFSYLLLTILLLFPFVFPPSPAMARNELQASWLQPETMAVIFSGQEQMHYEVSWTGGVKVGDIYIQITPAPDHPDTYGISVKVVSGPALNVFYPVDDVFHCVVSGETKLPLRYEVFQREGRRRKLTKRVTWYAQKNNVVKYQKNDGPEQLFTMDGMSYNELAAFLITRALRLQEDAPVTVPTFVDGKRHLVQVRLHGREKRRSIFGEGQTLKVQPLMNFKGLYEKSGNTLLWLTDDQCRVPVEISSRIALGSLVARLVEYRNPACTTLKEAGPSQDK